MDNSAEEVSPKIRALRERRAAIEAERAEIAAQRSQREAEEAEEALTREAEAALRDERLVEQFGVPLGTRGIHWDLVSTVEGAVVLKRPPALIYRQFQELDKLSSVSLDNLVIKCLAFPPVPEYHALVQKLPALSMRCADVCADLAGHAKKAREGK